MDNQEVMDRMVDLEQEVLRLKDENQMLKEKNASYLRLIDLDTKRIIEWGDKAGAWDDLEALVNSETWPQIKILHLEDGFSVKVIGEWHVNSNLAIAVSNALESIKGES